MKSFESQEGEDPRFSNQAENKLQEIITRYPVAKSALMSALYIAQEECGYISDRAVKWVANRLDLPVAHVL